MNVVRVVNADAVKPLHVVLVCLLGATLVGNCLLTSGPMATIEGAKDWSEESVLRAIVHVLNLSYTQTTPLGVEIKTLAFGMGIAAAAIAAGVALIVRPPASDEVDPTDEIINAEGSAGTTTHRLGMAKRQLRPVPTAQAMLLLYLAWSFGSVMWSDAPELAVGGSMWLAMGVVWALVLGRGLGRSAAQAGALVLVGVCAVTGVVAIAYFGERNPVRRASYPIGNPLFLAACLLPGLILAVTQLAYVLRTLSGGAGPVGGSRAARGGVTGAVVCGLLWAAVIVVTAWTVRLTGSRSALVALGAGVVSVVILLTRGRVRTTAVVVTAVACVAGMWLYVVPQFSAPSSTGRDASLRLRGYAWGYASELIEKSMMVGHGQGGFVRLGDGLVQESDAQNDPIALDARLAHAHNEWLEVWVDLGLVGMMLLLASLG
ncbi:MAG: O-antigen ligase family protein, partial [Phycisphaerales bacterium]|nr:O-antigen ligase family protein [Phycisphaerales bacterium]